MPLLMFPLLESASEASDLSAMVETFLDLALAVWPLWVLLGVIGLAKLLIQLYRLRRLAKSGIEEIDVMDGRTFELFLATLFGRLGYRVENTRYRGDYGADLVVKKDGAKTAVQAKRWNKRVGIKAVQEAVAAKGYYHCDHALVVANREFTKQALVLARANEVELWDRDALVTKLLEVRRQGKAVGSGLADARSEIGAAPTSTERNSPDERELQAEVSTPAPIETLDTAHCAICGAAVSAKVREYCLARPARFGGKIYCFNHQRDVRRVMTP